MRLLIVDDSRNNRLTLSALLESEGFEVDVAGSVAAARARCPETKIVMLSGSSQANAAPFKNVDGSFENGAAFSELMALLLALLRR